MDVFCDKKNIFDHILYEIEMYLESYKIIVQLENDDLNFVPIGYKELFHNMAIESHSIHARNLLCFFSKEKTQDDIIVSEILSGSVKEFDKQYIKDESVLINKCVAHLTKTRMNDETPSDFLNTINEVHGKIMVSVCGFVDALCEGSVKQEYVESLNDKMIVLRLNNINRMLETNNVCGNKMYASTASAPLFNSSMKT